MAHVRASWPVEPNFMPAMNTTLGASGSRATASGSVRSQRIVSTPRASSAARASTEEKRDTPITRRSTPAACEARRAIRASVGPIFPATPSTRMSPARPCRAATTSVVGALSTSSSCSTERGASLTKPLALHAQGDRPAVDLDPVEPRRSGRAAPACQVAHADLGDAAQVHGLGPTAFDHLLDVEGAPADVRENELAHAPVERIVVRLVADQPRPVGGLQEDAQAAEARLLRAPDDARLSGQVDQRALVAQADRPVGLGVARPDVVGIVLRRVVVALLDLRLRGSVAREQQLWVRDVFLG